jgi:hypothetical protein
VEADTKNRLVFSVNDGTSVSEAMTIKNSGNVGIGTGSTDRRLMVYSTTSVVAFRSWRPTTNTGANNAEFVSDVTATGTTHCVVEANGDLKNTNNTYTSLSDERLKQQISDASSQLDDFRQMKFRKYKLNEEVENLGDENVNFHMGLIAQELEQTSPGLVKKSSLENSMRGLEDERSVKYSILYMKGMKALQEMIEKYDELEDKYQEMIEKYNELENKLQRNGIN